MGPPATVTCSLHAPWGGPCGSPWAPGLSLTWAETVALLRGALGPLLGGAGGHLCPFLRHRLHSLILLFTGTAWLLEQT